MRIPQCDPKLEYLALKEEIDAVREHDPIMAKKMEAITFAADDFLQYMIQIGKDMGIDR